MKKFISILLSIVLLLFISSCSNVSNVENDDVIIDKEKNYVVYNDMNIKLPYSKDFSVTVNNNQIVLSKGFNLTINEFLKYVYPPDGKRFTTTNSYASSNGDSSFVIQDYITVYAQYFYNGSYSSETLDLIFCGYGKNYKAKYISKNGSVPIKIGNFATSSNNWRDDIYFERGQETVLIGKYTDSTKVEIKVMRK